MPERQPLTFWDHVDELRRRLIRSIVVLVVAATGGFWLSPYAQSFLVKPFVEHVKGTLALLAPGDGFVIQVKLGIMLGLIIASPFVAYQMYGFIGPGLKPNEKAWLWPVVTISTILFWGGVVFAWYIMPAAIEFLGSFAEMGIQNMWSLKTYISLIIFLLLSFGVIFQLPLLMCILIALGIVPSKFFRKYRRFAIVIIFIVAGVVTPTTDALTMMLMVIPLVGLYEISIWIGVYLEHRRSGRKAESQV